MADYVEDKPDREVGQDEEEDSDIALHKEELEDNAKDGDTTGNRGHQRRMVVRFANAQQAITFLNNAMKDEKQTSASVLPEDQESSIHLPVENNNIPLAMPDLRRNSALPSDLYRFHSVPGAYHVGGGRLEVGPDGVHIIREDISYDNSQDIVSSPTPPPNSQTAQDSREPIVTLHHDGPLISATLVGGDDDDDGSYQERGSQVVDGDEETAPVRFSVVPSDLRTTNMPPSVWAHAEPLEESGSGDPRPKGQILSWLVAATGIMALAIGLILAFTSTFRFPSSSLEQQEQQQRNGTMSTATSATNAPTLLVPEPDLSDRSAYSRQVFYVSLFGARTTCNKDPDRRTESYQPSSNKPAEMTLTCGRQAPPGSAAAAVVTSAFAGTTCRRSSIDTVVCYLSRSKLHGESYDDHQKEQEQQDHNVRPVSMSHAGVLWKCVGNRPADLKATVELPARIARNCSDVFILDGSFAPPLKAMQNLSQLPPMQTAAGVAVQFATLARFCSDRQLQGFPAPEWSLDNAPQRCKQGYPGAISPIASISNRTKDGNKTEFFPKFPQTTLPPGAAQDYCFRWGTCSAVTPCGPRGDCLGSPTCNVKIEPVVVTVDGNRGGEVQGRTVSAGSSSSRICVHDAARPDPNQGTLWDLIQDELANWTVRDSLWKDFVKGFKEDWTKGKNEDRNDSGEN